MWFKKIFSFFCLVLFNQFLTSICTVNGETFPRDDSQSTDTLTGSLFHSNNDNSRSSILQRFTPAIVDLAKVRDIVSPADDDAKANYIDLSTVSIQLRESILPLIPTVTLSEKDVNDTSLPIENDKSKETNKSQSRLHKLLKRGRKAFMRRESNADESQTEDTTNDVRNMLKYIKRFRNSMTGDETKSDSTEEDHSGFRLSRGKKRFSFGKKDETEKEDVSSDTTRNVENYEPDSDTSSNSSTLFPPVISNAVNDSAIAYLRLVLSDDNTPMSIESGFQNPTASFSKLDQNSDTPHYSHHIGSNDKTETNDKERGKRLRISNVLRGRRSSDTSEEKRLLDGDESQYREPTTAAE